MTLFRTFVTAALAGCVSALSIYPAFAGTLEVTVTGVRSDKGAIMAGLVRANPDGGEPVSVSGVSQPARAGEMKLVFPDLPAGDYAVRMYHDENGNGQMDQTPFGLPAEGYGFSNEAKASFGPPKFDAMKVAVPADGTVATRAVMSY